MLVDVKDIVSKEKEIIKSKLSVLEQKPVLEIITASDDPASAVYVRNKIKTGIELGIDVRHMVFDNSATTEDIINHITDPSNDANGIIVQLPLREGLDKSRIVNCIPSDKDVDGFGKESIASIFHSGHAKFEPCTPKGIIKIITSTVGDVVGKNITIINRSDIVGKPLALMLINMGATVTVCNSHTENLQQHLHKADVVVTAVGVPNFLNDSTVFKIGALVIDVSINRNEDGKLCGDCSESLRSRNDILVTPVPGGVGLTTVVSLMSNCLNTVN